VNTGVRARVAGLSGGEAGSPNCSTGKFGARQNPPLTGFDPLDYDAEQEKLAVSDRQMRK